MEVYKGFIIVLIFTLQTDTWISFICLDILYCRYHEAAYRRISTGCGPGLSHTMRVPCTHSKSQHSGERHRPSSTRSRTRGKLNQKRLLARIPLIRVSIACEHF